MKCPHCLENFNAQAATNPLFNGSREPDDLSFYIKSITCANQACKRRIIMLGKTTYPDNSGIPVEFADQPHTSETFVFPKSTSRPDVNISDIPSPYSDDYRESCNVLPDSAKASAALSRRILQQLLREKGGVSEANLFDEIGEAITSPEMPSRITTLLDGVREIGNFAAHPIKSTNTGEIVDVEPGEAELNLEVIEELFDLYFTRPKITQQRISSINQKLAEAGKDTLEVAAEKRSKSNKK